ncbi:MAG: cell division protein ZapA [Lachnospiraceae bacterium]|nr:cell division protein ZapA [Lachnospiraceae bacterium]
MSAKSNTEVIIGGKVYTLSGYEGEEYLQRVAAYINNKISDFNEMKSYRRLPADMRATLVQLNVADDYFKAKERIELLEADLERKEKELYELKHELISIQIKAETSEKNMEILKIENSKLEAALKASTETKEKK